MKDNFNQSSIPPVAVLGDNFKFTKKLSDLYLSADQMPAYQSADAASDPEEQRRRDSARLAQETYGRGTISFAYYSMRINGVRPVDQFLEPEKYDPHYQEMRTDLEQHLKEAHQYLNNSGEAGKPLLSPTTPSGLSFLALGRFVDGHVDGRVTYMRDKDRYGIDDFFQHPAETALYKTGDCEDFALLKRKMLRDQGVPNENVFLIFGTIGERRKDGTYEGHSTLLIKDEKGDFYILNNDKTARPIPYEEYKKSEKFDPSLIMDDHSIFLTDNPFPKSATNPSTPKPVQQTAQASP